MTFNEIFADFVAGSLIKRECWKGYWKFKDGKIMMHNKDGSVIDFLDTQDVLFTVANICMCDWEIAYNSNCEVLMKECSDNIFDKVV